MKKIIITLLLFFITTTAASAAELIMFSSKSCGYCRSFLNEVAPIYNKQDFSELLPLRIIDMDTREAPQWFASAYDDKRIDPITGTPSFVVFDRGHEIARLVGYSGKENFLTDMNNFVNDNRGDLKLSKGMGTIPYEEKHEVLLSEVSKYLGQKSGFQRKRPSPRHEGSGTTFNFEGSSHDSTHESGSKEGDVGTLEKHSPHKAIPRFPNGVIKSRDILDHVYETETEAQIAANFLGCDGTHSHIINGKVIWMPCLMQ